jgi:uncharacterized membrane-anchored protein
MRSKLIPIFASLCLCFFGFEIYKKEQILKDGQIVYLELAPRDPRSIMQGDYMRLDYKIARVAPSVANEVNIAVNDKGIGELTADGTPKPNEFRITFHKENNRNVIRPDSFLFQEGHAKLYEPARYGIFKFDKNHNKLLMGLADKDLQQIKPTSPKP